MEHVMVIVSPLRRSVMNRFYTLFFTQLGRSVKAPSQQPAICCCVVAVAIQTDEVDPVFRIGVLDIFLYFMAHANELISVILH